MTKKKNMLSQDIFGYHPTEWFGIFIPYLIAYLINVLLTPAEFKKRAQT